MKSKIFFVLIALFLINFVSAQSFCVDFDAPGPPTNLTLTLSGNNIQLNWDDAIDTPDCSGINFYEISRGFNNGNLVLIGNLTDTNFLDENLDDGTYEYIIHAWDLAGHEGNGTLGIITLGGVDDGGTEIGSSGGGDSDNFFSCEDWEKCVNGTQTRFCVEASGSLPDRIESRDCIPAFRPFSSEDEDLIVISNKASKGDSNYFSALTGAVTGTLGETGSVVAGLFVSIILLGAGVVAVKRRRIK